MAREFRTIGVVGLGTMGAGIAEVFARNGFDVIGVEMNDTGLTRGRGHLQASTDRAVKRGKLTDNEQAAIFDRVHFTTSMDDLAPADLVIEAVPEHLDLKQDILARVDKIVRPDAILATNTSSLSVTEISVATTRPALLVGVHFFNPAPVLRLVEVVKTVVTDAGVVDDVQALVRRLGKQPVVVGDKAGFIANALLFGYLNHAVRLYESRYASREDIDAAMRLGAGYPMGPLALLDLVGLDTAYEILDTMYRQTRDRLHAPAPILKQLVTAGLLGRKTGRGFYTYEKPDSSAIVADHETPEPGDGTHGARLLTLIGVAGSGTMAKGIIEAVARAGYEVVYVTRGEEKVAAVRTEIERSLDKAVLRGRLTQSERDAALGLIRGSHRMDDLAAADLVIEAAVEELSVKQALFETFDEICKPGAVLATTTSSLPVIEMAAATKRPSDVIGLHFFNPAQTMQLVEVVRTVHSSAEALATGVALVRGLDKTPVVCGDRAGFIVNTLLFPYLNDAVKMLEAHYASADDMDTAMKVGCGYPMGPFELLDVVGLDVAAAIQIQLYREFREPGFAPAPLLEHLVTAGYLGHKSGRGFRVHD
jgi:3-hydroxybutyryl-CoA dehydrogenase